MNTFNELKKRTLPFLKQKSSISLFWWHREVPLWVVLLVLIGTVSAYSVRHQSLEGQWKTYVNTQYGYTIDYPANWLMRDYGSSGSKGLIYLRSSFINLFTSGVDIHERKMDEPDLTEVLEWGEGLNRYTSNWSDTEMVTIGQSNYEAMARTYYTRSGILGRRNTVKVYYVIRDHQVIALDFDPHEKYYEDAPEAFDQMLDSFQLIDAGEQE